MKTKVTELLRTEYPIIQGGMDVVAEASLASAVSSAGALGVIGAGGADPEYVREQIGIVREITDKPFGVNILLKDPRSAEIAQLLAEEHVDVVTVGDGNPSPYMTMWHDAGCVVIPIVTNVSMAQMMEQVGADAIIARGMEALGSIGSSTTLTLVPQVADAVSIPVIAAGGIADGRGLAASIMLGAQGVQMCTRFIVAEECIVHENYKKKILSAKDSDSEVLGPGSRNPMRQLKNGLTREYQKKEKGGASAQELHDMTRDALKKAAVEGDVIHGMLAAGQIAGLIKDVRNCSEIISSIVEEAGWLLMNGPIR